MRSLSSRVHLREDSLQQRSRRKQKRSLKSDSAERQRRRGNVDRRETFKALGDDDVLMINKPSIEEKFSAFSEGLRHKRKQTHAEHAKGSVRRRTTNALQRHQIVPKIGWLIGVPPLCGVVSATPIGQQLMMSYNYAAVDGRRIHNLMRARQPHLRTGQIRCKETTGAVPGLTKGCEDVMLKECERTPLFSTSQWPSDPVGPQATSLGTEDRPRRLRTLSPAIRSRRPQGKHSRIERWLNSACSIRAVHAASGHAALNDG